MLLNFFNEIKKLLFCFHSCALTDNILEYVKNDVSVLSSKNEIIHQILVLIRPNKMELLNTNIGIF